MFKFHQCFATLLAGLFAVGQPLATIDFATISRGIPVEFLSQTILPPISWTHDPLTYESFVYAERRQAGVLAVSSQSSGATLYKRLDKNKQLIEGDRKLSDAEKRQRVAVINANQHALVSSKEGIPLEELPIFRSLIMGVTQALLDLQTMPKQTKALPFLESHGAVVSGKQDTFEAFKHSHDDEILYGRVFLSLKENPWLHEVIEITYEQLVGRLIRRVTTIDLAALHLVVAEAAREAGLTSISMREFIQAVVEDAMIVVHAEWNDEKHSLSLSGEPKKEMVAMANFQPGIPMVIDPGDLDRLQRATPEELNADLGIERGHALALWRILHPGSKADLPTTWNNVAASLALTTGWGTSNLVSKIIGNLKYLDPQSDSISELSATNGGLSPVRIIPPPLITAQAVDSTLVEEVRENVSHPSILFLSDLEKMKPDLNDVWVDHLDYGRGKIIAISREEHPKLTINFIKGGVKVISVYVAHSKLKIVGKSQKMNRRAENKRYVAPRSPVSRDLTIEDVRGVVASRDKLTFATVESLLRTWASTPLPPTTYRWFLISMQRNWDGIEDARLARILKLMKKIVRTSALSPAEAIALRRPFISSLTQTELNMKSPPDLDLQWSSADYIHRLAWFKQGIRQIQRRERRVWIPLAKVKAGFLSNRKWTEYFVSKLNVTEYTLLTNEYSLDEAQVVLCSIRQSPDEPVSLSRLAAIFDTLMTNLRAWATRSSDQSAAAYFASRLGVYSIAPPTALSTADPFQKFKAILESVREAVADVGEKITFEALPAVIHQAILVAYADQLGVPLHWISNWTGILDLLSVPRKPFRMRNFYLYYRNLQSESDPRTVGLFILDQLGLVNLPAGIVHPAETLKSPHEVKVAHEKGWIRAVPWLHLRESVIHTYLSELASQEGDLEHIRARQYEQISLKSLAYRDPFSGVIHTPSLHGLYTYFENHPNRMGIPTPQFIAQEHRNYLAHAA